MVERLGDTDWSKWAPTVLTALMLVAYLLNKQYAGATPTQSSLVELRADIANLTSEVSDLRAKLGTMPGPNEVADLTRRVGGLEADYRQEQVTNGQLRTQLASLQQQVSDIVAASRVPLKR